MSFGNSNFPFPYNAFAQPSQFGWMPVFPIQPINFAPLVPTPDESGKKYRRTWTKEQAQALYSKCKEYAQHTGRTVDSLNLADFQTIALGFAQSAEQCMAKCQEITNSGTFKSGAWSEEEDQLLHRLLEEEGMKWGNIAKTINAEIHHGLTVRTGKKCKERWNNHLNPAINRGKWIPAEDLRILEAYKAHGNKWSLITKEIGNRTESSVKNRIKSILNREKQELGSSDDVVEAAIQRLRRVVPPKMTDEDPASPSTRCLIPDSAFPSF